MRRVSAWLFVATCTFALGFAAATLWLQSRHLGATENALSPDPPSVSTVTLNPDTDVSAASNLPVLDYCELANNPERYSGKVVRVRARLSVSIHGALFGDEHCAGADKQAAILYHALTAQETTQTLNRARGSDSPANWHEPVDIIAIGKFEKVTPSNASDTIYDTASLQFEITRVEKASKQH